MKINFKIFLFGAFLSISTTSAITHGITSLWGQFPYYAYLESIDFRHNQGICGGIIINDWWILTSGHCLHGVKQITVNLGSIIRKNLLEIDRSVHILDSSHFFIHPFHSPIEQIALNDIGLIHLDRPIQFSHTIQPISMPYTCNHLESNHAFVMGFGITDRVEKKLPDLLQWVPVNTVTKSVCKSLYPFIKLRYDISCAVSYGDGTTCIGDSGSPLVRFDDNQLLGIVNLVSGLEGCRGHRPKTFTLILPYLTWIANVTGMELPRCTVD